MWSILIVLLIGIAVGTFFNWTEKMKAANARFQYIGVMLLLFTMGVGIGANGELLSKIWEMGYLSLTFALTTSLFSILIVYLISNHVVKRGGKV